MPATTSDTSVGCRLTEVRPAYVVICSMSFTTSVGSDQTLTPMPGQHGTLPHHWSWSATIRSNARLSGV